MQNTFATADPQAPNTRSWKVFAELITSAWQKQAGAIIEVGRLLLEAKRELGRDEFEALLRLKLPFDSSVARKLQRIAGNSVLCAHVHKLPPAWGTLYELSKLEDGALRAAIEDGRINPKMERKDALALRGLPPKAPKKPAPLLLAWRAASDKEKIALLDTVSVAGLLKAMSLAFRRELEGRLREEKGASTDRRVTQAFRLALDHVRSADMPEATEPVAKSQEAAALAALRGILRIHPNLHDLIVRVQAAESMKHRRAAKSFGHPPGMPRDHDPGSRQESGPRHVHRRELQGSSTRKDYLVDTYTNGRGTAILPLITPKTILGAGLANRHLDARQKACLVADVLDGLATFVPSVGQIATIFNVSIPYINVARRLSAGKRAAILRDWDQTPFTELMNPPRQVSLAGPVIPSMKMITDADLENLVRNAGIERVLEAAVQVERT